MAKTNGDSVPKKRYRNRKAEKSKARKRRAQRKKLIHENLLEHKRRQSAPQPPPVVVAEPEPEPTRIDPTPEPTQRRRRKPRATESVPTVQKIGKSRISEKKREASKQSPWIRKLKIWNDEKNDGHYCIPRRNTEAMREVKAIQL
jgi:hypothetical protein